jgi:hypothetical protein
VRLWRKTKECPKTGMHWGGEGGKGGETGMMRALGAGEKTVRGGQRRNLPTVGIREAACRPDADVGVATMGWHVQGWSAQRGQSAVRALFETGKTPTCDIAVAFWGMSGSLPGKDNGMPRWYVTKHQGGAVEGSCHRAASRQPS